MSVKFKKYIEQTQKITKISQDRYLVVSCLYKKFHSENSMRLPFQLQILSDTSHLSETSSEILRFVSSVGYHLFEMLSISFHTILAWNHDISTSPMIFRHYFLFLYRLAVKFRDKDASNFMFFCRYILIQVHEYHFSFQWFQNFFPLLIYN